MNEKFQLLFALSIRQPWAWLIVNGFKDIENRGWRTKFRGPLLIHAGKLMDDMSLEMIVNHYRIEGVVPSRVKFDVGGIVGVSNLLDCVTKSESKWFHGPFGFQLADSRPLPFTLCRGRLNFFKPDVVNRDGQ